VKQGWQAEKNILHSVYHATWERVYSVNGICK
jgi:hypothetical protein